VPKAIRAGCSFFIAWRTASSTTSSRGDVSGPAARGAFAAAAAAGVPGGGPPNPALWERVPDDMTFSIGHFSSAATARRDDEGFPASRLQHRADHHRQSRSRAQDLTSAIHKSLALLVKK